MTLSMNDFVGASDQICCYKMGPACSTRFCSKNGLLCVFKVHLYNSAGELINRLLMRQTGYMCLRHLQPLPVTIYHSAVGLILLWKAHLYESAAYHVRRWIKDHTCLNIIRAPGIGSNRKLGTIAIFRRDVAVADMLASSYNHMAIYAFSF